MKIFITLLLLLMLLSPATAIAATTEVEAGLDPDSRFYWFDRMAERIKLVFTLDPQAKSEALSKIGLERLAEAEEVEDEETVGRLISDYLKNQKNAQDLAGDDIDTLAVLNDDQSQALEQLNNLVDEGEGAVEQRAAKAMTATTRLLEKQAKKLEKIAMSDSPKAAEKAAKTIDKTTTRLNRLANKLSRQSDNGETAAKKKTAEELSEHVLSVTGKHLSVLERILEKNPDSPGIKKALENSQRGQETAVGANQRRGPKTNSDSGAETASDKKGQGKGKRARN